jgi:hypothetical protein
MRNILNATTTFLISLSFVYFLIPILPESLNQLQFIPRLSTTWSIIFGILGGISILWRLAYKIHLNRIEERSKLDEQGKCQQRPCYVS